MAIDPTLTSANSSQGVPQRITVKASTQIKKGQVFALYNPAGRLFLQAESRGLPQPLFYATLKVLVATMLWSELHAGG